MLKILTESAFWDIKILYIVLPFALTFFWRAINTKYQIFYSKSKENNHILEKCPSLKNPNFKPTLYLMHPYLQTLGSSIVKFLDKQLTYEIESVNLSNGGHTTLAWAQYPSIEISNKERNDTVAVIIPGLTGSSKDHYVKDLAKTLLMQQYKVVVFQPRFNGEALVFPESGYLNILDDFTETMEYLKSKSKASKYIAIGHSYGANLLVNFLGQRPEKNFFSTAVSLANPCNFMLSECKMRKTIIDKAMKDMLIRAAAKAEKDLPKAKRYGIDMEKLKTVRHVRDFDREFAIKVYGYETPEDYYWDFSCIRYLKNIKIPLLMIQAEDDPVVEAKGIPREEVERENSRTIVLITKYGGHQGWVEGFFKMSRWYLKPTIEFLNANN